MGLISKYRKARSLSAGQWCLVVRAAVLLWRAAWLLRRRTMEQLLAWSGEPLPLSGSAAKFSAQEISEMVAIAVGLVMPAGSCLPQSLVTSRLLKRAGYRASIVIGAKPSAAVHATGRGEGRVRSFTAHAWVEVDRPTTGDSPLVFNKGEHEELVKLSKTA